MRVLVLRARDDARRTAARLGKLGFDALVSPVLEIVAIPFSEPQGDFRGVIATSAHAFEVRIAPHFRRAPIVVVGERTAQAAGIAGHSEVAGVAESAAKLLPLIRDRFPRGARLLYLAGRDRKPDLETTLADEYQIVPLETYAAEPARALSDEAQAAILEGRVDVVLHYSRRSAEIFVSLATGGAVTPAAGGLRHVAISRDAAAPLIEAGWRVDIAERPDEDAMIALISAPHIRAPASRTQQEEK